MMAMPLSPSSSSASSSSIPLHFDQAAARSVGDFVWFQLHRDACSSSCEPSQRKPCDTVYISGSAASAPSGSRQVNLRCASHCSAAFWGALRLFTPEDHHEADDAGVQLFLIGSRPPQCYLHNFQPRGCRSDAKCSAAHRGGAHGVAPGSTRALQQLGKMTPSWRRQLLAAFSSFNQKTRSEAFNWKALTWSCIWVRSLQRSVLCFALFFFFKWPWFSAYCPQHSKIITYLGKITTLVTSNYNQAGLNRYKLYTYSSMWVHWDGS